MTVQNEGGRQISRRVQYYNLDVIISVGYRVKSKRGTQFRQYIEIWRLFYFFLLYLKKVKVFHNFSCVFEKM